MASTRKSDFTSDRFGDYEVLERAEAESGKRRWLVKNTITGTTEIVLQTELAGLVKRNDIGQRVHGVNDPIIVSDPDKNALPADDPFVGIPSGSTLKTYEPRGEHCESAMIALAVIDWTRDMPVEAYARPDDEDLATYPDAIEVEGFVALPHQPEVLAALNSLMDQMAPEPVESFCGVQMPEDDWTGGLPVDATGAYDLIEKAAGLGENAEHEVTEATLDARSAELPKDPMKKALRDIFDVTVELRQALARAEAAHVIMRQELEVVQGEYEQLIEKLDQALKVAITR